LAAAARILGDGLATGAGDDRRLGAILVRGAVLPVVGDVLALRLLEPRLLVLVRLPARLAVFRPLAVACHRVSGLPGLPVTGVAATPLAVLAQRDALGIVPLGLVGLIVAPLALLAGEGDTDAHISAGHGPGAPSLDSGQKEDPP